MNMKAAAGFLGGIVATFVFEYGVGAAIKIATARKESDLKKERVIRPGKDEAEKAAVPADAKFFHGQTVIKNKSCLFVPIEYVDKDEDLVWYERHRP